MNLRQRFRALAGRDVPTAQPVPPAVASGGWNPLFIDLTLDPHDWAGLNAAERESLLRLVALGRAGDEGALLHLLPLIMVMADEQRLEEELSLTSFLWEEAKHVEIFRRFFAEVAPDAIDLSRYRSLGYCRIVHDELPSSLLKLRCDASPECRAEASVVYNLIVVGLLVETGYRACLAYLEARDIMPGMRVALGHLLQDTTQHLERSVDQLAQQVAEYGDPVRRAIERRAAMLKGPALEVLAEALGVAPFGLERSAFGLSAGNQLDRRCAQALR